MGQLTSPLSYLKARAAHDFADVCLALLPVSLKAHGSSITGAFRRNGGVSGLGVIADGAALETYSSAQEPENRPNPPTSARRGVSLPILSVNTFFDILTFLS